MSNDLISRSALIKDLKKQQGLNNPTMQCVMGTIHKLPTAYDADKVKNRLKELKEIYPTGNGDYEYAIRVDKAIEAVEVGTECA